MQRGALTAPNPARKYVSRALKCHPRNREGGIDHEIHTVKTLDMITSGLDYRLLVTPSKLRPLPLITPGIEYPTLQALAAFTPDTKDPF